MTFPSKIDWWLAVILVVVAGGQIAGGIYLLLVEVFVWPSMLLFASAALIIILYRWTYYTVGPAQIEIRSGPFCWQVRLDEIERIIPSRETISAPAMSLDRLRIEYRQDGRARAVLISPRDKQGFLAAVAALKPGFKLAQSSLLPG